MIGGALLEHFWWGSVFLLNVPVMLVLLGLAPVLLPESRDPKAGRLDFLSESLSLVSVLAVIYGIKRIAEDGSGWQPTLAIVVRRVRPAYVMAGGFAIAAIGFEVLTQIGGPNQLAVVVIGLVIFSLGLAPVVTVTTDLVVGTVPPERAGAASGLAETSTEFGGALGIAVLGSIVTASYRSIMAHAVPPGVPTGATETARDTLGGALAAAQQLHGQLGAELLTIAREAFAQAFQLTAAISAVLALAAAILAVVLQNRVRAGSDPAPPPDLDDASPSTAGALTAPAAK